MRKILVSLVAVAVMVPLISVFAQQNPPVSKTFKVGADCKIMLEGDKAGALTDLKVGEKVGIAYHEDGTTLIADKIHQLGEPKTGDKPAKPPGGSKNESEKHARGKITAVDAKAGTITIAVHNKPAPTTAPAN